MKKIGYLLIVVLVGIMAGAVYFYMYKDHRNIAEEKGSFSVTSHSLFNEFKVDEAKANAKYLDQTIIVSGSISEVHKAEKALVLDGKMFVSLTEALPDDLDVSDSVKVKGRFLGYDELLEELKMDQSILLE